MPAFHRSRRYRALIKWLLLPALALRALIPAGFMPGEHSGFGMTMTLCTAHGVQSVIVYPNGEIDPTAPDSGREAPCKYALSAVAAPLPLLAFDPPVFGPEAVPAPPRTAWTSNQPFVRAHAPRAPPLA